MLSYYTRHATKRVSSSSPGGVQQFLRRRRFQQQNNVVFRSSSSSSSSTNHNNNKIDEKKTQHDGVGVRTTTTISTTTTTTLSSSSSSNISANDTTTSSATARKWSSSLSLSLVDRRPGLSWCTSGWSARRIPQQQRVDQLRHPPFVHHNVDTLFAAAVSSADSSSSSSSSLLLRKRQRRLLEGGSLNHAGGTINTTTTTVPRGRSINSNNMVAIFDDGGSRLVRSLQQHHHQQHQQMYLFSSERLQPQSSTQQQQQQQQDNNEEEQALLHQSSSSSSTASSSVKTPQHRTSSTTKKRRTSTSSSSSLSSSSSQQQPEQQHQQQQSKQHNGTTTTTTPSPKLGTTRVPTPPVGTGVGGAVLQADESSNPLSMISSMNISTLFKQGIDFTISIFRTIGIFLLRLPSNTWYLLTHPKERRQKMKDIKDAIKHEVHHYWVGTKLLWADIQTARGLLGKTLDGETLSRRERKQLLRTVSDLFRLVPFSMFILIPFMEFALPFALRIFPNLLPSTYQDSLKAEENMKRELKSRIAMAQFFQETLEELAKEQKRKAAHRKKELQDAGIMDTTGLDTIADQADSAASMLEFLEKAQNGEMIPPDVIIRYANYFQDDLTLDNMPRMQLINMCKYMSISPYGSDAFLRFQLRHRIRVLKEDDQRILWEGINSLNKNELREACQERGMRSTGLSKESYKQALQQWLELSVHKNVPISLLIMSRTFFLREDMFSQRSGSSTTIPIDDDTTIITAHKNYSGLADAISGLDREVVNEVILEVATSEEKLSDPAVRKIKLDVLEQQNQMIREEQEARDKVAAKKKAEAAAMESSSAADGLSGEAIVNATAVDSAAAAAAAASSTDAVPTVFSSTGETTTTTTTTTIATTSSSMESVSDVQPSIGEQDVVSATVAAAAEQVPADAPQLMMDAATSTTTTTKKDDDDHLSSEEMDAIAHLVREDPVCMERAELERIKAAMKGDDITEEEQYDNAAIETTATAASSAIADNEATAEQQQQADSMNDVTTTQYNTTISAEETDRIAAFTVKTTVDAASAEADASTSFSLDGDAAAASSTQGTTTTTATSEDQEEIVDDKEEDDVDPVVSRLKKRIESMVGRIEEQLSDVQLKIGDKLHLLDKDRDGILSLEEMAMTLQQVLKRKISFEEAMEIAHLMDKNEDGYFTVDELIKWIDETKLVKFVEEGRDVDMDRILTTPTTPTTSSEQQQEKGQTTMTAAAPQDGDNLKRD